MSEQNRDYLYTKFENGDIPDAQDFKDMIDSALNLTDDGLTSYKITVDSILRKRFGIGDTAPGGPLGIKGEDGADKMIYFTSNDAEQVWNINLNPTDSDLPGFSIDDASDGTSTSRLFIQPSTGNTGIGSLDPTEKLEVQGLAENAYLSAKIKNEGTDHAGWMLGHYYDSSSTTSVIDGSFSILEEDAGSKIPRITILPKLMEGVLDYYNVGVNEPMPFATLHVSRPVSDPMIEVNLAENTGIIAVGPIDDQNLILDNFQIQARTGGYAPDGTTLAFTVSELGLQPLGGDIRIHRRASSEKQILFTDDGKVAIGKDKKPTESLEVLGAIRIGDAAKSDLTAGGTIRYTGKDFEGSVEGKWQSLTKHSSSDGIWTQPGGSGSDLIYFNPSNPTVGIGTDSPEALLHVDDVTDYSGVNGVAALISSEATRTGDEFGIARISLQIVNKGAWGSNSGSPKIGLYVSEIDGLGDKEANIAALLNGNVVIGDLTGESLAGTDGSNVLAIQTGTVPNTAPGTTTSGGIQIYSTDIDGSVGTPVSVFNLMNGDGSVIQLFAQSKLTDIDINVPNTGNAVTDAIINNTRTRLEELENRLIALGLFA